MNLFHKILSLVLVVSLVFALLSSCDVANSSLNSDSGLNDSFEETPNEDIEKNPDKESDKTPDGEENTSENDGEKNEGEPDPPKNDEKEKFEESEPPESDPYVNVNKAEFYANYKPATSYMDAYYRTQHFLMSGSIESQDQYATISEYRPMINSQYCRNSAMIYSDDGNTYYIVDYEGDIVGAVYRGGAYVTLEEVAAYVYAFGEIPQNYISKKSGKPSSNPWGMYLRLNHSRFSGNTSKYPYEPVLPNISGCGGDLYYYEMDIGTTGTTCDPEYKAEIYNDGNSITRGAARIVYGKYDLNGNGIYDEGELYLFYTHNHYNDFREYLNYRGGWGEMFGNITGGGTISSTTDYNPTDYVPVKVTDFTAINYSETVIVFILPRRLEMA